MTESYSTLAAEGTKVIQPLEALACAATCFDLTIEASQLAHQLGLAPDEIDSIALCRCAAWIGLRARKVNQSLNVWESWYYPFYSVMVLSGMFCCR